MPCFPVPSSDLLLPPISPDDTYQVLVDDVEASSGSLLEDFTPSVNPEKEIDDPEDLKPADWVDEEKIVDTEATKPEEWDEEQPFQVVDEEVRFTSLRAAFSYDQTKVNLNIAPGCQA